VAAPAIYGAISERPSRKDLDVIQRQSSGSLCFDVQFDMRAGKRKLLT
jgi:hypothetical protein